MATDTALAPTTGGTGRRRARRPPPARGPDRAAARDADDARHRGAGDEPLPPGQGPRLVLRRLRPGGGLGRRRVRDGARGPAVHPAPRPGRPPDPRRRRRSRILAQYMGRAAGRHPRARRQRALRRPHARLRRDGLDAPRHDAGGDRYGDGVQAARRAALRADLVRRRLDLPRRLPRGDELGRRAEAAGRVRPGEQPVRLLDAAGQAVRGRPGGARRRLRLRRGDRRRQRRGGDVRGDAARRASARSAAVGRR